MRRFVIGTLLLMPSIGMSAEWEHISHLDTHGSKIEIDLSSLRAGKYGTKKAWFKWTYTKPRPLDYQKKSTYSNSLNLYEFKCKERQYAQIQALFRDGDGEVVLSIGPFHPSWIEVAPETIGEIMLKRVCDSGET